MDTFATDAEIATYCMLQQVLQNHVALQKMSILATTMACTGLLGDCCLESRALGSAPPEIVAAMVHRLKSYVRARQALPPFLPFEAASAHDPAEHLGEHSRHLYDALRQLLHDTRAAQRIDSHGSLHVVLKLLADVLSMFLHQFGHALEAIDTIIDTVVGPSLDSYLATPAPPAIS